MNPKASFLILHGVECRLELGSVTPHFELPNRFLLYLRCSPVGREAWGVFKQQYKSGPTEVYPWELVKPKVWELLSWQKIEELVHGP